MIVKPLPSKLRLHDGVVVLEDGSDTSDYLKQWAKRRRVSPATPICIVDRATLQNLIRYAELYSSQLDARYALAS